MADLTKEQKALITANALLLTNNLITLEEFRRVRSEIKNL